MSRWTRVGVLAVAAGMAAACGDDSTGPSGQSLSTQERTALTNALTQSGALGAVPYAGFAAAALQYVATIGTLQASTSASVAATAAVSDALRLGLASVLATSYEGAVGFIMDVEYAVQGDTARYYFVGVVGWNGVNTTTNTVDNLVVAGVYGDGAPGTTVSGNIGEYNMTQYALGAYWDGSESFFGTSGTISATAGSFGGGTDCSGSSSGFTYQCSYTTGTMVGNFEFTGLSPDDNEYVQAPVSFASLPTLKIAFSLTD